MNKLARIKSLLPHIIAMIVFVIISVGYFSPSIIDGKVLQQHDILTGKAMQKELSDYRQETGKEALWTNSMFSGMPAYQISVKYFTNFLQNVRSVIELRLPSPADYIMLYLIGFFVLLLVLGVNPWLSIAGAIAFAFSSYFFIIIGAGHIWKVRAIAFIAPTLAGIILTYRGKYLSGGVLTAVALTFQLFSNHIQMTYYFLILVGIFSIGELVLRIKEKDFSGFLKSVGVITIAFIIALGVNITNIWSTYEYGKYTIRGKSELTFDKEDKTDGLDRSYVTGWSYGIGETWSFLIPNVKGGASGYLRDNKSAMEKVDVQMKESIGQNSHYWGDQPGTSGPVYMGAIIVFLFVLGLFILKWRYKWPLIITTILVIFLSWGKNWMGFTDFFLDYFPFYNKFRAVSSILIIAELAFPLLAFLTLKQIWESPDIIKRKYKQFFISFGLTAGISLVFYLIPNTFFSFLNSGEISQFETYRNQNPESIGQLNMYIDNLEMARVAIFKADAIRSFFFILLGAVLLWFFGSNKVSKSVFLVILPILLLLDLAVIDKRYLSNDDFLNKRKSESVFKPSIADNIILKDSDPNFRVMNLTTNTFNEAMTSYFHKSIGGYHGAKLQRYQELIEYHISKNNMSVLNMLNTKYFIVRGEKGSPEVQVNMNANGNSWFVNKIDWVENANEEILKLNEFDSKNTAVIDKRFESFLEDVFFDIDSVSYINLKEYQPNHLIYSSSSGTDRFAVFSEIYYPKGWNAYIDGILTEHIRVNYVLRGLQIPKGDHIVEFKFEPKVFIVGEIISRISLVTLMLVVIIFVWQINRIKK